jgi:hypothetical protein
VGLFTPWKLANATKKRCSTSQIVTHGPAHHYSHVCMHAVCVCVYSAERADGAYILVQETLHWTLHSPTYGGVILSASEFSSLSIKGRQHALI